MGVCRLPASILTAAFVAEKVASVESKALLGDLRRPHSRLFAVHGDEKQVHVFDQTNMAWLFCAEFPVKDI